MKVHICTKVGAFIYTQRITYSPDLILFFTEHENLDL
jgi:hypothetical protein